jgi:hypothetical protein
MLAQAAAPEPIPVSRELAQAVSDAIQALMHNPTTPEIYAKEACWRDLRSRRWSQVTALQNRVANFLAGQDKEMSVTDADWTLMDGVIGCVEAISAFEHQSTESTLKTVATLIGVVGGAATLIALL